MISAWAVRSNKTAFVFVTAAVFYLTAPRDLLAQELQLSLTDAIKVALTQNPALGITQAQTEIARDQLKQASLRPNPRITLQTEDLRPGTAAAPFSYVNSTEDYFLLGQPIETGGKRGRRMDVARSNIAIADSQDQLFRRQLALQVSVAYWNAALARRIHDLTGESLRTYDADVAYLTARVKEGVASEGDLIRLQIERDRASAAALQARRDSDQAAIALLRAMGRTEFPALTLTTPLADRRMAGIPPLAQVLTDRPEIAIASRSVEEAENNIRLQHAFSKPDPEVYLGYKRNIGYDTAYVAVQVDLPVSNRNQGNISAAEAQLHLAQSRLQTETNAVRADYESAVRAYHDQQQLLAAMPETVAHAEDSEKRARAAYREGGIQLLLLIDTERTLIQVETEYARALAAFQLSLGTLEYSTGAGLAGGLGK